MSVRVFRTFDTLGIKAKFAILVSLLIAVIASFVYLYFPARFERQAISALGEKARSISEMTAYALAPALVFDDRMGIREIAESLQRTRSVEYIIIVSSDDSLLYSFGEENAHLAGYADVLSPLDPTTDILKVMQPIVSGPEVVGKLYLGLSLEQVRAETRAGRTQILVISLLIIVVGSVAAVGAAAYVAGPLTDIVRAAEKISTGDLTGRAPVSTRDEIGQLALAFNHMVEQLEAAYRNLEAANRTLEERVRARTRALLLEIDERKHAEALLREREQLIQTVASIANRLLHVSRWEDIIDNVLEQLGTQLGVARAYIFQIIGEENGEHLLSQTYEWVAEGIHPEIANQEMQQFKPSSIGFHPYEQMLTRGEMVVAHTRELPARMRGFLQRQQVRSILLAPIKVEERFWGFIGFDECVRERTWTTGEIEALKVTADALGAAIARQEAEEALRVSEQRYRQLLEEDLTGDFLMRPDGTIIYCNSAFARIFGFESPQQAMEHDVHSIFPTSRDFVGFLERIKKEGRIEYGEMELRRLDGQALLIVANITGIFDDRGHLSMIRGYLFDDTRRRMLEEQLIQSQRLETVGTLAGGIAHDFNNILAIILSYASMLPAWKNDEKRFAKAIQAITEASQRGATLVRQLLTFARKAVTSMQAVQINTVVADVERIIRETFPRNITLEIRLAESLPLIAADVNQLHQVFLNICLNARDAMPDGGTLTIATRIVSGESLQTRFPGATASEYVHARVTDTGIGMTEEVKARIFEPFFTTKEREKGTGLGLAVVFGIVESHGGFIDVESSPGKGTTLHLYFPSAAELDMLPSDTSLSALAVKGGTETILIVEDEDPLREFVQSLLQGRGYSVITARDGDDAIRQYSSHATEVDLVLTDMGLPRMDGLQVVRNLRALNPSLKIILATGYLQPTIKAEMEKAGVFEYVQKPFSAEQLLRVIRSCLDSASSR